MLPNIMNSIFKFCKGKQNHIFLIHKNKKRSKYTMEEHFFWKYQHHFVTIITLKACY